MISIKQKGDFSKLTTYLKKQKDGPDISIFHHYGATGVSNLRAATPKRSGVTASSWDYTVEQNKDVYKLIFTNSNENKGVPIAIILQYGHQTGTGGWVYGNDYINPALKPIFDDLANELWKEVNK